MARSKGEGTLYQRRDGRWCAQVTLAAGKRKSFYGATRKLVKEKMAEYQRLLERGVLPDERQTVALYLRLWLDSLTSVRATTKASYLIDLKRLCAAPFADLPLHQLKAQHLQLFYAELVKRLSSSSVRHTHGVLHHALRDAVRLGVLDVNVADRVDAPRQAHHEMATLDEAQVRLLLAQAAGHPLEALFILALDSGMRRGELLALRWADVDLERAGLSVRAGVQLLTGTGHYLQRAETKTANSRRQILLSGHTIEALKAHRTRQKAQRLQAGPAWQEHDLVFPGKQGGILDPQRPGEELHKLLAEAGLPSLRFHDLRHTAITIMLARGLNAKLVAERAGDNVLTILRVYAHVTPSMQAQAAAVMDSVLGG